MKSREKKGSCVIYVRKNAPPEFLTVFCARSEIQFVGRETVPEVIFIFFFISPSPDPFFAPHFAICFLTIVRAVSVMLYVGNNGGVTQLSVDETGHKRCVIKDYSFTNCRKWCGRLWSWWNHKWYFTQENQVYCIVITCKIKIATSLKLRFLWMLGSHPNLRLTWSRFIFCPHS